ncbi:glycosyltransferase family 10 domain-containing protein [Pararcticibacter amylolyticus]|uniref:Fucosyltransferase C-terminal domain-containing protein n=1 Tax=Pararcticibacter amylolyticus TaxID=2173175 RepID=A0A2U2PFN6_9SPHI|nr:glycosyltransferase family 10 [Pararcticibacter amylolyticus]PWG80206.1 hypothetical protein DDR33_13515 [Pararcticibacter amylolyticus]
MKIKFFADYDRSVNLLKRVIANYGADDDDLAFTTADDYDYAVVFNRTNEKLKGKAKIITVVQEPSFSDVHHNNPFLKYSDHLIVHDQALFENLHRYKLSKHVIESPSLMFYQDPVDRSFFRNTEDQHKERKISMIVSSLRFEVGNYGKRLRLLRRILSSDLDIDIFGRGFSIQDDRYKGELDYKLTGLLPYEYSIGIENSNEKNYVTEKFFDCSLCNTVPIYNGAPNIEEVYNEKYYRMIDLDAPDLVDQIKEIIKHPAPKAGRDNNKLIYFTKYNLYTRLKEIILNE